MEDGGHPERSRGTPEFFVQHTQLSPHRGPSTPLRSAQDDGRNSSFPSTTLERGEKRKVARASSLRWFGDKLEACVTPCGKTPNAPSTSRRRRFKIFRP